MNRYSHRPLRIEKLDPRLTLSGDAMSVTTFANWHNESNASDINGDGYVTGADAVTAINLLMRFDGGSVNEIQSKWATADASAQQLFGDYHPDVTADGQVTALDLLQVINKLAERHESSDPQVSVVPDDQGRPLNIVYEAEDGRIIDIDVSQRNVSIEWINGNAFAINGDNVVVVIASRGEGMLEADLTTEDGVATVTRLEPDGRKLVETYVCFPGFGIGNGALLNLIEPDDVRLPIEGFEGALGSLVTREVNYSDGAVITFNYEEAALPNLLSVSARRGSESPILVYVVGETIGIDTIIYTRNPFGPPLETASIREFESDLLHAMGRGLDFPTTMTPNEFYDVLQNLTPPRNAN